MDVIIHIPIKFETSYKSSNTLVGTNTFLDKERFG